MDSNSPEFVSLLSAAIWWRDYATRLENALRAVKGEAEGEFEKKGKLGEPVFYFNKACEGLRYPESPYPALHSYTPHPPPGVMPKRRGLARVDLRLAPVVR